MQQSHWLNAPGNRVAPLASTPGTAFTYPATKPVSSLLLFALLLVLAQATWAASVIYAITSDEFVLNNPSGT